MTLNNKKPILIALSLTLVAVLTVSFTFSSIVNAFVPCDAPQCYKISFNGKDYKLTGKAASAYGDLQGRQIDYLALKEQLPMVGANEKIAIVIEGSTAQVNSFVTSHAVEVMKSKISTDNSYTSIYGYVSKDNLEKYYTTNPMEKFVTSEISIASLGGYSDETGDHGPFGIKLTDEQRKAVGAVTSAYETQEMTKIITQGIGVEELAR